MVLNMYETTKIVLNLSETEFKTLLKIIEYAEEKALDENNKKAYFEAYRFYEYLTEIPF